MILAEQLRLAGVPTFPCWARFNETRQRWDKGPAVPKGVSWLEASRQPFEGFDWSGGVIGVPIPQGVLVLDLDVYKGASRAAVEQYLGCALPWDLALIQRTIGGGEHYAFACDWDARQGDSLDGVTGFDTRAAGKGFICSGAGYSPGNFGVYAFAHPAALPQLPAAARAVLERQEPAPAPARPEQHQPSSTPEIEQVLEALRHVDPGTSRTRWRNVGYALRGLFKDDPDGEGFDLFERWSAGEFWHDGQPANYVSDGKGSVADQWPTFKADGGVNPSTLFFYALEGGWRPPVTFNSAAAFGPSASTADADTFEALVVRITESGGDILQTASIVEEIRAAGCNALQVALLAAELKGALKDAGVGGKVVANLLDELLAVRAPAQRLVGSLPEPGASLDENIPLHPDAWAPMQTKGKDMKPKGTQRNFEIMLQAYGVRIEFDEIAKDLRLSGPSVPAAGVLHDEAALSYLDSLANLNEYPTASVKAMIMPVANKNTVNPVVEWVSSTQWDGRDHMGALWSQIEVAPGEDAAFCELLFRKWFRGAWAIGAGLINRWEFAIVLVDPNGGRGKTRFFSTLCPAPLRTDSVILDTDDKDSVKMAVSYWLTELGELDGTFNRSDSNKLKGFLARERDEMRLPYGRAYLKYPRRTAFFASTNEVNFLNDPSDNRRYWAIRVSNTNHMHNVDMRQVWAQVAAEVQRGEIGHLTPQEDQVLRMRNEAFRTKSPIGDALASMGLTTGTADDHRTASEILLQAGIGRPSKSDLNEAARWLRRAGFNETKRGAVDGFCVTVSPRSAKAFTPKVVE
jgi:hypothetical protein